MPTPGTTHDFSPETDLGTLQDFDLTAADENLSSNNSGNTAFWKLLGRRMSRRRILTGLAGTAAAGALFQSIVSRRALGAASRSSLTFTEIPHIQDRTHHVADGYTVNVLLRWGDPVTADAPAFDPMNQSAEDQAQQFGYNSDYVGFQPLPAGSKNPNRGLLCVNHEYTIPHLMFPNVEPKQKLTKAQTEIEMAAHGHSVVEIVKQRGKWSVVQNSRYNRRIHASTPIEMSGPAAGHERLRTNADPTGTDVLGTINNCAGGLTPWGTILIAEENFNSYFGGEPAKRTRPATSNDTGWHREVIPAGPTFTTGSTLRRSRTSPTGSVG